MCFFQGKNRQSKRILEHFLIWFQPLREEWEEVEGCVVVTGRGVNRKRDVRKLLAEGYSRTAVERAINHLHMSHLLDAFGLKYTDENRRTFATLAAAVIEYRIKRKYPEKQFVVEIFEENLDYGKDTTVTYCQREEGVNSKDEEFERS